MFSFLYLPIQSKTRVVSQVHMHIIFEKHTKQIIIHTLFYMCVLCLITQRLLILNTSSSFTFCLRLRSPRP